MTYFTGLARVAKTTGYPVHEIAGWKTRGHGHMGTVKSIIVHHTAGSSRGNYPSLNVVAYGRAGLAGPLSHYGLGRDGTIYVIAAGLAAHAGRDSQVSASKYKNIHAIGIEAENTGVGEEWSDAQLDSYAKLCRALVDEFKLSVNDVVGHKEIATPRGRKIDPNFSANGIDMDDFRAAVKANGYKGTKAPAASKPASTKKPAPKPAKSNPKATADDRGIQTYLKNIGLYKGVIDGVNGSAQKAAVKKYQQGQKYFPGMLRDGHWGKMTQAHFEWTKRLQAALNQWKGRDIPVDGYLGSTTIARVKDVQSRNKNGAYKKADGVVVDGIPGPITCKMLGIPKHPSA